VAAVLNDLSSSGLLFVSGRGRNALYRGVTPADRREVETEESVDGLAALVWVTVNRHRATSREELRSLLNVAEEPLREAIALLLADGRLTQHGTAEDSELRASTISVPVGAEHGWEAAVFDHFSTVAAAIGAKVQRGPRSAANDLVGGATLSFEVHAAHPCKDEVYGLLARVRGEVNELWNRVVAINKQHPVDDEQQIKVSFYFGQNVERRDPFDQEPQEPSQ
jgi:hypothetical protein